MFRFNTNMETSQVVFENHSSGLHTWESMAGCSRKSVQLLLSKQPELKQQHQVIVAGMKEPGKKRLT